MKTSAIIFLALVLGVVVEGQDGAGTCFQRIKGPPRKVKWAVCNSKGKHSVKDFIHLIDFSMASARLEHERPSHVKEEGKYNY